MRYIDWFRSDPSIWLLFLMVGGIGAAILYVVLSSITF